MEKLYSKILILVDPILHTCRWEAENDPDRSFGHRVGGDSLDVGWTVVLGLQHKFDDNESTVYPKETQLKIMNAKLAVLCSAIEVNEKLGEYIKEVIVLAGSIGVDVDLLRKLDPSERYYVGDHSIRAQLDTTTIRTSVIADSGDQITPNLTSLAISPGFIIPPEFSLKSLQFLTKLILPNDPEKFWKIAKTLPVLNLNTFKMVFHDDPKFNDSLLRKLDNLVNLEIRLNNSQLDSLDLISYPLKKLSIVSNSPNATHKLYEVFDLAIIGFIQKFDDLNFLSISHVQPQYGKFIDGVEGNYLRRLKLYNVVLPQIILNNWPDLQLHLPNLFQSLANYEQRMNTMLWIGCKCKHCSIYLHHIDQYLIYHKHYNRNVGDGEWRDLNSSTIFTMIGNMLSKRCIDEEMLLFDQLPYVNKLWDMHEVQDDIPFRCYEVHVVDHGEFDEAEAGKVEEPFFDANDVVVPCTYTRAVYQGVARCVAHFLHTEVVGHMTNLYRGDAEKLDSGEFNDGGDELENKLRKLVINGINYNLGQEVNGTNFYECVYD